MPEPRMAYIPNRRLFENAFEIASKNKFQQYWKISLKPSLKINAYLYGETGVGKNKTSERNSKKRCKKVIYTSTDKVWNKSSVNATQWTNIQTKKSIL